MLGQEKNLGQLELFRASLSQIINPEHVLVMLANLIPWKLLETHFSKLYSKTGTPSHPIRLMTGIPLLQRIYNLSDERITALWQGNPYFQFFCDKTNFHWQQPCAASDLVHFRKRLGEAGIQLLFFLSIQMHQDKVQKAREVLIDTTLQHKNITYPTDEKLYKKVIERCNQLAQSAGVKLRQSYRFVVKKLSYIKRSKRVVSKLRTLTRRQARDLAKKLAAKGSDALAQFSE